MLWLGIRCLNLSLAALPAGRDPNRPLAMVERQRVCAGNAAAAVLGVAVGQPLASALARCPGLQVVPRDPARETAALEALGMACYALTPTVALHPPTALLLEAGGCLRLFGGLAPLLTSLGEILQLHQLPAALGAAPTPAAALLLTHAGADPLEYLDPHCGSPRATFDDLLRNLPLGALDCEPRVREALARAGLRSLGALLALPGKALGRRYGQELLHYLERIRGRQADPQIPLALPPAFHRTLEFAAGIAGAEMLRFPARRLLQELSGYLRARQRCCGSLRWRLSLEDGTAAELPLRLARPRSDLAHLLELTRLGLAPLRLPAPVIALALHCDDLHALADPQPDLLGASVPAADAAALQALCDRLAARLGTGAVTRPAARDEHLPERAAILAPAAAARHHQPPPPRAPRPLWLVDPPQPLAVRAGRPCLDGPLVLESGPERIEGHWWCAPASRDYYRARTGDGRRCWLYRERRSGGWFLHGLFG